MKYSVCLLLFVLIFFACNQNPDPEPEDFGFLTTIISVEITEEGANARTDAVNTDDFVLIIYDAGDNVVMTFDPFSTAPNEVQLPVGEYYVVANSNDLVEAGFDNPYYFGRSANFTIDKEESKTVDIVATLANAKVAINYSTDVVNTFDVYEGTVTVTGSGTILTYVTGETREGYFVTSSPLDVEVSLVYNKLDGTTIERSLTATISDPQPKTLYNINVDATLDDGVIVFNLTVDESVEVVDIDLTVSTGWIKHYGGSLKEEGFGSISKTSDGAYIIGAWSESGDGDLSSNNGSTDFWFIKLSESGDIIWQRSYGGGRHEGISGVHETTDGGFIGVGVAHSEDGDISNKTGDSFDPWMVKLDAAGNLSWEQIFLNVSGDFRFNYGGDPTSNGGVVLCGYTSIGSFPPTQAAFIMNVDGGGNVLWETTLLGMEQEIAQEIIETQDGGFLVVGNRYDNIAGASDVWLSRLDASGNEQWESTYGGSNWEQLFVAPIEVPDGYIFSAYSNSNDGDVTGAHGDYDLWMFKIDFSGNIIWQNAIGGSGIDIGFGSTIAPDGDIIITGSTTSTDGDITDPDALATQLWLVKASSATGNLVWQKTYGGTLDEAGHEITAAHDSGFVIVGKTNSTDGLVSENKGAFDLIILKVDEDGNL